MYLRLRQLGPARVRVREPRALARPNLDDVRALRDQRARRFRDAIRPPELAVDGVAELRIHHEEREARLRPDVARRDQHVGPRHVPHADEVTRVDRLQVGVARTRAVVTPDWIARSAAAGDSMCACASIRPGSR